MESGADLLNTVIRLKELSMKMAEQTPSGTLSVANLARLLTAAPVRLHAIPIGEPTKTLLCSNLLVQKRTASRYHGPALYHWGVATIL
jgi:hypothetical protein